ncbi:sulfur carrier protein ThiS [Marinomonas mediterranea]|uniref:sulfur carrier protein ThiS n=1 Tax=Marinomonas mediterranea TaxID=119864 RepID=UPI00234BD7D3|nr:sulfur carrier protein ThiS [Marinomonas mediterranea]WCN09130.1 sulfur carrier protein ThiS [Marinomonas mediterranea]
MEKSLLINGDSVLSQAATIRELIDELDLGRHIAVAVNDHVVPKSQWDKTDIQDGMSLDLFESIAGG